MSVGTPRQCTHCGKYYEGNPNFCPNCGNGLTHANSLQQQRPEPIRSEAKTPKRGGGGTWIIGLAILGAIVVGIPVGMGLVGPPPAKSPSSVTPQTSTTSAPEPHLTGAQYFSKAQASYAAGDYAGAADYVEKALERAPGTPKMLALQRQIQAKIAAQQVEQQRAEHERALQAMAEWEGDPLAIAIGEVRITSSVSTDYSSYTAASDYQFVWLGIAALNKSNSTIHANPNYFTLSTPNGQAFNPSTEATYSLRNYFNAIDLPSHGTTFGWLVFHVPKYQEYVLNMNSFYNHATKQVIGTNWSRK